MKTNFLIILTLSLISCMVRAQIVNIPDPVFKDNLVNHPVVDTNGDGYGDTDADTNDDGEIQVSEAEAVLGLYLIVSFINSLEGLQSFVNLEVFESHMQLFTSIDVSTMPNLRDLQITNNQLTSLDITQNPNLEILQCHGNDLTQLDTSQNNNLIELSCWFNQITSLNVTQNPNLVEFSCGVNLLTTLDVTQNPLLEYLNFGSNNVTEIDLSQNINLIRLECGANQLSELDVSQNINLTFINCRFNLLTEIDVSNNSLLEGLVCSNNQISFLDVSQNVNFGNIQCQNNQLIGLNIQNGNNENFYAMLALDNPNLTCIQVDDFNFANEQICNLSNENGWCKDDTAIYSEDCNLGLDEFLNNQITLFPNPVKDKLFIKGNNGFIINNIQLYDVLGKKVMNSKNTFQIDVSTLTNGLFFIKVETNKGVVIKKVIKK